MQIPYPTRSKFQEPCEEVIRSNRTNLLNGNVLSIHLSKQGYDRDCLITIFATDPKNFETDWKSNHPSRFSSRIRAAALALHNHKCFGTFQASHHFGLLTIKLADNQSVLLKKVAISQFTDGVRINKSFHDYFNPPSSASFVAKGSSRPISVKFNDKKFTAKYLHENPTKVDREMQSIRFSRELMDEFKSVFPDEVGYFSIELEGNSHDEFVFKIVDNRNPTDTESFAKKYIRQEQGEADEKAIAKKRRDRLRNYSKNKASNKITSNRGVNQSDAVLKEDIKQLYQYHCQICSEQIKKVGWVEGLSPLQESDYLFADAHHVTPLENGGFDTPSNIICVCPNCHRRLHTGELNIHFKIDGPQCVNQITAEAIQMTIDPDHSFGTRQN